MIRVSFYFYSWFNFGLLDLRSFEFNLVLDKWRFLTRYWFCFSSSLILKILCMSHQIIHILLEIILIFKALTPSGTLHNIQVSSYILLIPRLNSSFPIKTLLHFTTLMLCFFPQISGCLDYSGRPEF